MAKHCTNCGLELRETDKFCAECGTPVGGVQIPSPQPVQHETCQIEYEYLRSNFWGDEYHLRFFADAVGPRGTYVAGRSAQFRSAYSAPARDPDLEPVLNDLIRNLTSEGWESLGRMGGGLVQSQIPSPSEKLATRRGEIRVRKLSWSVIKEKVPGTVSLRSLPCQESP